MLLQILTLMTSWSFSNDHDAAVTFFSQLFHRHVTAMSAEDSTLLPYASTDEFVREVFASPEALRELVRAGEGVPRDAINIIGKAALKADHRRISIQAVREAARRWYLQDKEGAVKSRQEGLALLHWIIDQVIGHRRARAFLLRQGSESFLVNWLYDQRVLHLVKRGIAAKDRPGVRFDAYALDYGCYVDLLTTRERAPGGLIATDNNHYLEVPPDEYDDNFRGAILDIVAFEERGRPRAVKRPSPIEIIVRSTTLSYIATGDEFLPLVDQIQESGWYLLTELSGRVAAIEVGHRALTIGSSTSSHIRVRNGEVLPKHALLSNAETRFVINNNEDAPVYVNSRRSRHSQLGDGDTIQVGDVKFIVIYKS